MLSTLTLLQTTNLKGKSFFSILSFVSIFAIISMKFPTVFPQSEMWAEMGTNYFKTIFEHSFFYSLSVTDAGYLATIQRIMSLIALTICQLIGSMVLYPKIVSFLSTAFIAGVGASLFYLRIPTSQLKNNFYVFLLALGLCLYPDYETNTFVNFIYLGFSVLLFFIFETKTEWSNRRLVVGTAVSSLIVLSKGLYIVFLPIILIVFILQKKELRNYVFTIATTLSSLLQIFMMYNNQDKFSQSKNIHQSFGELVDVTVNGILFSLSQISTTLFSLLKTRPDNNLLMYALTTVIVLFALYKLSKQNIRKDHLYFFGGTLLVTVGTSIFIALLHKNGLLQYSENIKGPFTLPKIKAFVFSFTSAFIFVFFLIATLPHKFRFIKPILLILLVNNTTLGETLRSHDPMFEGQSFSNWQYFANDLKNDKYAMPLSPYPWVLSKGLQDIQLPITKLENNNFQILFSSQNTVKNIYAVAIQLKNKASGPFKVKFNKKDGSEIGFEEVPYPPQSLYRYYKASSPDSNGPDFEEIVLTLDSNEPIELVETRVYSY